MPRWTTSQRDSMLRQVSDTTIAVAAGAVLGTAVVIAYAAATQVSSHSTQAADASGSTATRTIPQTQPQTAGDDQLGDDGTAGQQQAPAYVPGPAPQGVEPQGGFGGGAPTTSGGS